MAWSFGVIWCEFLISLLLYVITNSPLSLKVIFLIPFFWKYDLIHSISFVLLSWLSIGKEEPFKVASILSHSFLISFLNLSSQMWRKPSFQCLLPDWCLTIQLLLPIYFSPPFIIFHSERFCLISSIRAFLTS